MTARRLHITTVRASTVFGVLLLAWTAGLAVAGEFRAAPGGVYIAAGIALIAFGWLGHPDRRRLQNAMHDIAEEIDPSALPASAEQTVVFDEARAPGHRHLPHGN